MKFAKSLIFCFITFLLTVVAQAQDITVKGKVVDEKGLSIPGVTVLLKGTTKATLTDNDGVYQFKTPANGSLLYSFVGYKTSTEIVKGRTTINVNLQPQAEDLKEVVVTALGVKRQTKALGYATQAVKGETLQTVRGVDVATSLTGKVAGLLVKNSSDFAEAPSIVLRGESNPLLVVDGVAYGNMSLREIPADDIESVNVLKGPTAAALYGVRGKGGAIMVTTKKGTANKGLSIDFNSGNMYTAGYLAIPKMQSSFGRVIDPTTNRVSTSGDGSWGASLDGRPAEQWNYITKQWETSPYLPVGKDNFDNFVSQGYIYNNNINLTQQGENGSLRASATWVKNQGQYPNSVFDKITYSLGGEMKMNKFTLSSTMTYNKQASPHVGFNGYTAYDPMYTLLVWSSPDYDVRDSKDYWITKDEVQNTSYTNTNNNVYFDRFERLRTKNKDVFNGSVTLDYGFTDWLKGTVRVGYDNFNDFQTIRVSKGSLRSAGASTVIDGGSEVWGESQLGSYNQGNSRGYSYNNDFILSANKKINDFTIEALGGATSSFKQTDGIENFTTNGLKIPGFYSINSSKGILYVNPYLDRTKLNSLYGRAAFSYKNIYFIEGTYRNDWASTLSQETNSYSYPSLSGSIVLSDILPKIGWLPFWKVRGSWTTAKDIPGAFDINPTYNLTNNVWGTLPSQSLSTTIRPSDLKAEGSETFEVGIAMSFFKRRASLDVAYYEKRKFDKITYASISSSAGYYTAAINSEEERTQKGFEIALSVTPIKSTDWQWDLGLNTSSSAEYYTKLESRPEYASTYNWVKVGERTDHFVINQFQKDSQGNLIHDSSGLPLYQPFQERTGYRDPKFIWGLTSMLKYKNITFAASIDGRVGGMTETRTEMYMWISGNHPDSVVPERFLDANNPGSSNYLGQGVKVVSGTYTTDANGVISDTRVFAPNDVKTTYERYVDKLHKGTAWGGAPGPLESYSTTFFKIREMALTYNFNKPLLDALHAKAFSFSLVGQNLYLNAKDFKYSDPDGGSENFSDPSQRFVGFNIKASF